MLMEVYAARTLGRLCACAGAPKATIKAKQISHLLSLIIVPPCYGRAIAYHWRSGASMNPEQSLTVTVDSYLCSKNPSTKLRARPEFIEGVNGQGTSRS